MESGKALALASLGLGLLGLFTGALLGLGGLLGLGLGAVALLRTGPEPQGGRDVAWAAIAANVCALLTILPLAGLALAVRPAVASWLADDEWPPVPENQTIFRDPGLAAPPPPPPPP